MHPVLAGRIMRNRLRVLRAEKRWSQAELGERVGVSRQAINAVETGKHDPSLTLAFALAGAFDLRIEEVFDPHGEPD
jgi:putative transcriptional regulator